MKNTAPRHYAIAVAIAAIASLGCLLLSPGAASGDGAPVPIGSSQGSVELPDGSRIFAIEAGHGTAILRITAGGSVAARSERSKRLVLPGVSLQGPPGGASADGSTVVLTVAGALPYLVARSEVVVFDADSLRVRSRVELEGGWGFDAISPDGGTLFLVEYLNRSDPTEYRVRAYDLATDRFDPEPIVDSSTVDLTMRGAPQDRVTSPDGRWEYTAYDGAGGTPFLHALDLEAQRAYCVGLEAVPSRQGTGMSLEIDQAGEAITVSTWKFGETARVATDGFEVTDLRSEEGSAPTADSGVSPLAVVLVALAVVALLGAARIGFRRLVPAG